MAGASFLCGLPFTPALAAGLDIGPGQTHIVTGAEVFDYLNIDPTGTLDFGAVAGTSLTVIDNGVDTTWSGLIKGTAVHADKDNQHLVKAGDGTSTLLNLTSTASEIHISNGAIQQTSGTNNLFILNVGSNVPAAGTGTFNISGGTLNIGPAGIVDSPSPAMQVGHFGGTGIVNQTGGIVNFANASSLNIGNQGGTGTYNISGGTLDYAGGFFSVGRSTSPTVPPDAPPRPTNSSGTLNISGNALVDVHGIGADLILGNRESSTKNFTTATLNQTGGTLRVRDGAELFLSGKQSTTVYNLLGGALEIGGDALKPAHSSGVGTYQLNLGGGTIRTIGTTLNAGINAALVADTTSTIDTNGIGTNWTGTITGTGNLNKAGDGTLTFSTLQGYSGTTFVNDGTLLLGGGGVIGTSSGVDLTGADAIFDIQAASKTIQDLAGVSGSEVLIGNKTLTVGSPRDSTFSGQILGVGGNLIKTGAGTLTLAGANNYTGTTAVNGGTLRFGVGGSITPTASLAVANGAGLDLGGAGAQTLATAPVSFGATSTYLLSRATGDTLTTGGSATLGGAGVFVRGLGGGFDPTADHTILTTTGIVGTFGSIDDDMPFLNAQLRDPTTEQAIFFVKGDSLEGAGVTPNQQAVGEALDNLPLGNSLLDQIVVLGTEDVVIALNSMTGEFHASTRSALVEQAEYLPEAVGDRIGLALGGTAGGGGADLSTYDAMSGVSGSGGGPGIWAQAYGRTLELDGDDVADLSGTGAGVVGGLDYRQGDWVVGVGGGYSVSELESDEVSSDGDLESYHALAYAGGDIGMVRLHVGGAYSWSDIDTTRTVILPDPQTLVASYSAETAQVFGEASVQLGALRPFAGANYINVSSEGFTETGGDAALTAASSEQDVTFTTLGVRAELNGGGMVVARGMVGWRHAFGDVDPLSSFTIQGSGFTVSGVPIAEDAFVTEAGVDVLLSDDFTLGVSYAGQIAPDAQEHGAKATATVNF